MNSNNNNKNNMNNINSNNDHYYYYYCINNISLYIVFSSILRIKTRSTVSSFYTNILPYYQPPFGQHVIIITIVIININNSNNNHVQEWIANTTLQANHLHYNMD